jgi:hypothetical protein
MAGFFGADSHLIDIDVRSRAATHPYHSDVKGRAAGRRRCIDMEAPQQRGMTFYEPLVGSLYAFHTLFTLSRWRLQGSCSGPPIRALPTSSTQVWARTYTLPRIPLKRYTVSR